jgi:hypothetical protein
MNGYVLVHTNRYSNKFMLTMPAFLRKAQQDYAYEASFAKAKLLGGGISMRQTDQQENIRPIHDQLHIHFNREWLSEFDHRIQGGGPWDDWTLYQLA